MEERERERERKNIDRIDWLIIDQLVSLTSTFYQRQYSFKKSRELCLKNAITVICRMQSNVSTRVDVYIKWLTNSLASLASLAFKWITKSVFILFHENNTISRNHGQA